MEAASKDTAAATARSRRARKAYWILAAVAAVVAAAWLGHRMQRPRGRASSPLDAVRPERWTAGLTAESSTP